MTRGPDYVISAVRYDSGGGSVERVRVHGWPGTFPTGVWDRSKVVELILSGCSVATVSTDGDGWRLGDAITLVESDRGPCLHTHGDECDGDDLGDVPGF